ncbi:COBRA-like protein 7 [Dionaea muscipula]
MAGDFNGRLTFTSCLFAALLSLTSLLLTAESQATALNAAASAPPPPPSSDTCNGIFISYAYTAGKKLPPNLKNDSTHQAYRFQSTLTVLNNGADELQSWRVFVGFQHDELLVSASNAVLADGTSLPAEVGNGTVFAGFPQSDLMSGIQTAGDLTQMEVQVNLIGTQFGAAPPGVPMPNNISLVNDGFLCPTPSMQGNATMLVCCTINPDAKSAVTVDSNFLPRQSGDLTIMYDVIRASQSNYWAQVTISNHNPLGRLDYWMLSWDWMRDEFIYTMKGAYPYVIDVTECIFGSQAGFYQGLDFSSVLNCQRRPTIVDLPLSKANDTNLGLIPYCCRNGTILPPEMDPSKSSSSFQMQVYKMPPDTNLSTLIPPQNWQINGTLNPSYKCGPPVRVSPSQFPDPNGLPTNVSAVASWQVVCNITQPKNMNPKCCVSFSSYYNESIIPCNTCACGCPDTSYTCSTVAQALLIPPEAQLVPFDNRTKLSVAWAELQHRPVPNPLPCGDNCGVSINWHLYTDYKRGWTARITLFNWEDTQFQDWFVAVEMDKAALGYQKAYSFNGTLLTSVNDTIFMQGLPGLNYLLGETNGSTDSDPRVPGKQQSVIAFTKKTTPGINVAGGDGFPTKVYFNGEECSLPHILPTGSSHTISSPIMLISFLLAVLVLMVKDQ